MPDPTDHSSNPFPAFDPEVPMALSAADIRRRGDRLRRRNAALGVVAGVAAIALIATPVALLSGGDDAAGPGPATQSPSVSITDPVPSPTSPSTDEPTDEPTASATTVMIPANFPLDDGLPATNGNDGTPVVVGEDPIVSSFAPCDDSLWSPSRPGARTVDVAGVSYAGEAEDFRARTLAVYADDAGAVEALQAIRDGLAACSTATVAGTDQVYDEVSQSADESVYTLRFRTDGQFDTGLTVWQFHRAGNALLLASYYGEGGGSDATIQSSIDVADRESAGLYAQLADVFGGADKPVAGGEDGLGGADLIGPADLPARERLGDWTSLDPGEDPVLRCQPTPYDVESVSTSFQARAADDPGGVSIGRIRTAVYRFDDASSAAGAYAEVATQLSTCEEFAGIRAGGRTDASDLGADHAEWRLFTYGDPAICTDCDGLWFDRMGVAQVGDRLLVLSYAEVGAPLEPPRLESTMRGLFGAAIARAGS